MLIYLLRHGAAEPKALTDSARELSSEGIMQTQSMVQKFKQYAPIVDIALMSPYQRAKQTASLLGTIFPALQFDVEKKLTPEADVYEVMELIELTQVQHLLLVSHNPLLSHLLSLLVDGTLATKRPFEPSNLVCIAMEFAAPGCGEIKYILGP